MLGVNGTITKENWLNYARKVVETKGNPTTKDANECNIPYGTWFEMSCKVNNMKNGNEYYINWANKVISTIEPQIKMINDIVDFLVDEGTKHSSNGTYIVDYREVSKKFNITVESVKRNRSAIIDKLDCRKEIISETCGEEEGCFDMNFCGNAICARCGCRCTVDCINCEVPHEIKITQFIVQRRIDGEMFVSIMTADKLIAYINMSDCHDEQFEIYEGQTEIGTIKKLRYVGWQPNCLIEVVDGNNRVVLSGYGEDH